jgi:hypothetical protein
MDASSKDYCKPWDVGAIFTQTVEKWGHHVITYASWMITLTEKNLTPFLMEMGGRHTWAMNHFCSYLQGDPSPY